MPFQARTEDPDGEMSCPDVFKLGGKVVVLISTGGQWDQHPKVYPSGWTQVTPRKCTRSLLRRQNVASIQFHERAGPRGHTGS